MYIAEMATVLTWRDGSEVMANIHNSYSALLCDRLGETLGCIAKHDWTSGNEIVLAMRSLPDQAFMRFLVAPETSFRLLWPHRQDIREIGTFFRSALHAERSRLKHDNSPLTQECWTASGDYCRRSDGTEFRGPVISDGAVPIDFESPFSIRVDLNGMLPTTPTPRLPLSVEEQSAVLARVENAFKGIRATDLGILNFVNIFTKALLFQRDPDLPTTFTSGSSGQYVGRSLLGNPHLESVDEVDIAEALVHEAIHSLLYMQEQRKPWVNSDDLYGSAIRTQSPWTGNPLPLRPYMQAAFVWYGLLHFWCLALRTTSFPVHRVQERVKQAALGFLGRSLLDQVLEYRDGISEDIMVALQTMQAVVCDAFQTSRGVA